MTISIFRIQKLKSLILVLATFVTSTLVWWNWSGLISSSRDYSENYRQCSPKQNVVFLKTHKCASSSIQNIFLRYVDSHNLTLVLPLFSDTNYLSSTKPFSRSMIGRVPWSSRGYNVLCHHVVFNYTEIEALMPADTVYVSIVRDPANVFESLYSYGNLEDFFNMSLPDYIQNINDSTKLETLKLRKGGNLGTNQMMYDFGMNHTDFEDSAKVNQTVHLIDKQFDLIMIAERFDESLILLKDLLCWNVSDLISFALNVRTDSYKHTLTKQQKITLRQWNSADKTLYDHFLQKFLNKLKTHDELKLKRDTLKLKKLRQRWYKKCILELVNGKNTTGLNKMVYTYRLREEAFMYPNCQKLVKQEIQYTSELRKKQFLRSTQGMEVYEIEEMMADIGVQFPDMINVGREDLGNVMAALSKIYQHKNEGFLPVQVRGPQ